MKLALSHSATVDAAFDRGDGRVTFAVRIGVTGHRQLPDTAAILPAVHEAIDLIRAIPATTSLPLRMVIVTALAEGADRLVAEEVLKDPHTRLEVALPLPVEEYVQDFGDADSKAHFASLLAQANDTWRADPCETREHSYEQAGRYVVDRADALIALWDGHPARGRGGTAEIVAYAREKDVPLVWIETMAPYTIHNELRVGEGRASIIAHAAAELAEYNRATVRARHFARQLSRQRTYWNLLTDIAERDDPEPVRRHEIAAAVLPYFVRADVLAVRQQHWFRRLDMSAFLIAAAAVTVVAAQIGFLPSLRPVVGLEVALLAALLLVLLVNRRWRFHDRWIAYRFLAERLRSTFFLNLAGTGDRRGQSSRLAYFSDPADLWIERALEEVMAEGSRTKPSESDVVALRGYLSRYWIGDQRTYHEKTSRKDRRRDSQLLRLTAILFAVTLAAAVAHVFGWGGALGGWTLASLFLVLSISLPATGAAVHGIRSQRQFRRHSQRYARMTRLLSSLQGEMDAAETLGAVQVVAADTERIMREENGDWFGVMRFLDMELIT
jgi:SMODS and SLOG-associating 2TM effector domain 1